MRYNYKQIILADEIPFDYSREEMNTPFVQEYEKMFSHLDLSHIQRFSHGAGQNGYDSHSMIKALIVYALEGYRSIPQLIRELKSKPYFSKFILGFASSIPHNSQFYRFLQLIDPEVVRKLLATVNKEHYKKKLFKTIAIDSKPVMANTKENNPKTFKKNLSDKTEKPKRNEEATLGYFTKSNDKYNQNETIHFFWGYRIHLIVDPEKDLPLTYMVTENNKKDFDVAAPLYCKLVEYYPKTYNSGLSQIADKGYYAHKVFHSFHLFFDGKSYIPVNKRNTDDSASETPTCKKGFKMKYHSCWHEENQDRFRVKFVCPKSKKPCDYRKTKYGCSRLFQVRKPYPGEVQQKTELFKKIYPLRQAAERVNSFLQILGWERPNCFAKRAIENILGLALLGKSLKAFL